ncbi:uncharacterized protein LOC132758062 [Ruditapes philippinarum]|uniref:uncharacterized protein LOC132758062 n=1 Tax=Ruditapes philippinarum TaxID=129788 RepID=UPI00295AD203|nr:uncharacterized protein LOC132758062 [Ruditapes philippinarum]
MYRVPNYTETVSMKLSEVLSDIGVDERIVMKRRRSRLLMESKTNINIQALDGDGFVYVFGSQSEGTTTIGIGSITLERLDGNKSVDLDNTDEMIEDKSEQKLKSKKKAKVVKF